MSTLLHKIVLGALVGAIASTAITLESGCKQQKPRCSSAHGDFVARYTVVSGPASCADLTGELLGVQTYNPPDAKGNPDLDKGTVAIQSESLGEAWDNADLAGLHDPDVNHKEYAIGAFVGAEPVNDFCAVSAMADAVTDLPAVTADDDLGTTDQAATQIRYQWSNVRFYVTAANNGSQFGGDLIRTQDGVACTYKVQGMYPYVDCSAPDPADDTKSIADPSACNAEGDPDAAANRPSGSGISPDFPVSCDPVLLACLLTKTDLPALK